MSSRCPFLTICGFLDLFYDHGDVGRRLINLVDLGHLNVFVVFNMFSSFWFSYQLGFWFSDVPSIKVAIESACMSSAILSRISTKILTLFIKSL